MAAHPIAIAVLIHKSVSPRTALVRWRLGLTLDDGTRGLDVLLTGHEDENVTSRLGQVDLQYLLDGTIHIIFAGGFRVEDFYGECTPWDGVRCGISKEPGEL